MTRKAAAERKVQMDPSFPNMSLHIVKDLPQVKNKTSMSDAAQEVVDNLKTLVDATRGAAHHRTPQQRYLRGAAGRLTLDQLGVSVAHPGTVNPSAETQLEIKLLTAHREGAFIAPWARLIDRQVPLNSEREAEGWGAIDLFGLTDQGRPVIIELKKGDSDETPLRAVLEAAAYAIAVAENWAQISWECVAWQESDGGGAPILPASDPYPMSIVVASEARFWENWNRWSTTGIGVPADTRSSLRTVVEALAVHRIITTFATIGPELHTVYEMTPWA